MFAHLTTRTKNWNSSIARYQKSVATEAGNDAILTGVTNRLLAGPPFVLATVVGRGAAFRDVINPHNPVLNSVLNMEGGRSVIVKDAKRLLGVKRYFVLL